MIRKFVPSMVLLMLIVSSSAFADIFVTPYGSFNYFGGFTTQNNLAIDTGTNFLAPHSVEASQVDSAIGGGIFIGTRSEGSGLVLGLNIEYLGGETDIPYNFYNLQTGLDYSVGNLKIESPALAVGGFIGAIISGLSNEKFQSVTGVEIGVIKPDGTITLDYRLNFADPVHIVTETQDFGDASMYMSFLFMEKYSLGDTFGISGTLGWRSARTQVATIETPAMSGGYAQQYGGFFLRFGLDIEF